jgi:hypothetical protein
MSEPYSGGNPKAEKKGRRDHFAGLQGVPLRSNTRSTRQTGTSLYFLTKVQPKASDYFTSLSTVHDESSGALKPLVVSKDMLHLRKENPYEGLGEIDSRTIEEVQQAGASILGTERLFKITSDARPTNCQWVRPAKYY